MVQVNPTKLIIRFKFIKRGSLQYISHLDLVRTMHKVIVRAKLPLYYTEGFNPKPKMVFAAPLSIGTESLCEYMDLRLNEYIDPKDAMDRLNANMTDEMQILEAYYPESKFTDIKWMSYQIKIESPSITDVMVESCNTLFSSASIEVQKKNSDSTIDIRPLIKSAEAKREGSTLIINAILSADPSAFLNPEYIIKAIREKCGILTSSDLLAENYEILRLNAYMSDMTQWK